MALTDKNEVLNLHIMAQDENTGSKLIHMHF